MVSALRNLKVPPVPTYSSQHLENTHRLPQTYIYQKYHTANSFPSFHSITPVNILISNVCLFSNWRMHFNLKSPKCNILAIVYTTFALWLPLDIKWAQLQLKSFTFQLDSVFSESFRQQRWALGPMHQSQCSPPKHLYWGGKSNLWLQLTPASITLNKNNLPEDAASGTDYFPHCQL